MVGQRVSDSYVQYILALVVPSLRLYVPVLLDNRNPNRTTIIKNRNNQ